jgi:hypothetical protein
MIYITRKVKEEKELCFEKITSGSGNSSKLKIELETECDDEFYHELSDKEIIEIVTFLLAGLNK